MIYPITMVTRCCPGSRQHNRAAGNIKYIVLKDLSFKLKSSFDLSFHLKFACWILYIVSPTGFDCGFQYDKNLLIIKAQ